MKRSIVFLICILGVNHKVNLAKLLEPLIKIDDKLHSFKIEGISINSKGVVQNTLFIAISGESVNGHEFIEEAIQNGAVAIVGEKNLDELGIERLEDATFMKGKIGPNELSEYSIPYIQVENSRKALAKIACQFYGNPTKNKTVIGITGTNGKTTTSFMLKKILEDAGNTCTLFGSIHNEVNGQVTPSINTTPDALELQNRLAQSNDDFVILEVSSHGISQHRIEGIEFDYCLFTNLDHEHLDYHHDMEDYFNVKTTLFEQLKPTGKAIINGFDLWGTELSKQLIADNKQVILLGQNVQLKEWHSCFGKLTSFDGDDIDLHLQVLGKHNILNASMALLTARELGITKESIVQSLLQFSGVPGRFEILTHPKGAKIVIDYAHTHDAFSQCLQTIKEQGAKRIFHIFGFRGNRDQTKRQPMVEISKELCDLTLLTLDDLNGTTKESMEQTLHELHGAVILDRTIAIKQVLELANEGDWVCITGKGHETYKEKFQYPTATDKETVVFFTKDFNKNNNYQ